MPQRFKILVILLVLSNIGVGCVGFFFLRAMDQKYSALLAQTVPALSDLQTLTASAVEAMHRTNPSVLGAPVDSEKVVRAQQAIEQDRQLRISLLARRGLSSQFNERKEFERAGDAFTRAASDFLQEMAASPNPETARQREVVVRPAFQSYVIATTKLSDALEADSLQRATL